MAEHSCFHSAISRHLCRKQLSRVGLNIETVHWSSYLYEGFLYFFDTEGRVSLSVIDHPVPLNTVSVLTQLSHSSATLMWTTLSINNIIYGCHFKPASYKPTNLSSEFNAAAREDLLLRLVVVWIWEIDFHIQTELRCWNPSSRPHWSSEQGIFLLPQLWGKCF